MSQDNGTGLQFPDCRVHGSDWIPTYQRFVMGTSALILAQGAPKGFILQLFPNGSNAVHRCGVTATRSGSPRRLSNSHNAATPRSRLTRPVIALNQDLRMRLVSTPCMHL